MANNKVADAVFETDATQHDLEAHRGEPMSKTRAWYKTFNKTSNLVCPVCRVPVEFREVTEAEADALADQRIARLGTGRR